MSQRLNVTRHLESLVSAREREIPSDAFYAARGCDSSNPSSRLEGPGSSPSPSALASRGTRRAGQTGPRGQERFAHLRFLIVAWSAGRGSPSWDKKFEMTL